MAERKRSRSPSSDAADPNKKPRIEANPPSQTTAAGTTQSTQQPLASSAQPTTGLPTATQTKSVRTTVPIDDKPGYFFVTFDNVRYEGQLLNNVFHGHGKLQWLSTGDEYDGQFYEGKMEGFGIYRWANGVVYEGIHINNVKNGYGIVTTPDLRSFLEYYDKGDRRWSRELPTVAELHRIKKMIQENYEAAAAKAEAFKRELDTVASSIEITRKELSQLAAQIVDKEELHKQMRKVDDDLRRRVERIKEEVAEIESKKRLESESALQKKLERIFEDHVESKLKRLRDRDEEYRDRERQRIREEERVRHLMREQIEQVRQRLPVAVEDTVKKHIEPLETRLVAMCRETKHSTDSSGAEALKRVNQLTERVAQLEAAIQRPNVIPYLRFFSVDMINKKK